jgi:AraC-like DNA-binding protein
MKKEIPSETSPAHETERSYWDGLRISLIRFFEGPPIGKYGTFYGVVFTAYKMLTGTATVRKGGVSVAAKQGDWIMCLPGERFQDFSDNARILSFHLLVESPGNAAAWSGGPVLIVPEKTATQTGLELCVTRLRESTVVKRLEAGSQISPLGIPETFSEALELQETVAAFFRRVIDAVEPLGMRYEAPLIRDKRVRENRLRLANADFREGFSRVRLAKEVGLSPTQMDRLWREELGLTPAQFWQEKRLQTACVLLQADTHSIKEIAYEIGFRHLSQFSFWFGTNMHESPRAFRSRHERD